MKAGSRGHLNLDYSGAMEFVSDFDRCAVYGRWYMDVLITSYFL